MRKEVGFKLNFLEGPQVAMMLFPYVFLSLGQTLLRRGDMICVYSSWKASREAQWRSPKSSKI